MLGAAHHLLTSKISPSLGIALIAARRGPFSGRGEASTAAMHNGEGTDEPSTVKLVALPAGSRAKPDRDAPRADGIEALVGGVVE